MLPRSTRRNLLRLGCGKKQTADTSSTTTTTTTRREAKCWQPVKPEQRRVVAGASKRLAICLKVAKQTSKQNPSQVLPRTRTKRNTPLPPFRGNHPNLRLTTMNHYRLANGNREEEPRQYRHGKRSRSPTNAERGRWNWGFPKIAWKRSEIGFSTTTARRAIASQTGAKHGRCGYGTR